MATRVKKEKKEKKEIKVKKEKPDATTQKQLPEHIENLRTKVAVNNRAPDHVNTTLQVLFSQVLCA